MYPYRDLYPISTCRVILKNRELWNKFHELETEMIITKSGRRMFPSIQIQVYDLDPHSHYCIYLDIAPASKSRYKYCAGSGWSPAGNEETERPDRMYVHPESPSTGEQWMSQPISFGRLKLTNTPHPPTGHVALSSMHKYQPRIVIVKTSDPRNFPWAPSTTFTFPETLFIAVTAYQNEKITKLKIDHNPFAKGFRENGQSKCKKRKIDMEVIDIISNEENSSDSKKFHNCANHNSDCESPTKSTNDSEVPFAPIFGVPFNSYGFPFSYFPQHCWNFYQPIYATFPRFYPKGEHHEVEKPKKITDFSIRAITGCT